LINMRLTEVAHICPIRFPMATRICAAGMLRTYFRDENR
jgi:hypothetical protein